MVFKYECESQGTLLYHKIYAKDIVPGAKFSMLSTGNHFVENSFIIVQITFSSDIIM